MESCNVETEKNKKAFEFIENVTRNADQVQKQVLSEILTRNSGDEYLQRHGLGGCIDTRSFKKLIPLVNYEDIQPDINRIANGDKSPILCSQPISNFFKSSGTSAGVNKLIPTNEEEQDRRSFTRSLEMPTMNQFIPGLDKGLYRYRVGDLLRVAGFKNKAPQFNFISRKNVALSIEAEKTDESALQSAVEKAVIKHLRPLDACLVDYTAYADTNSTPGHYVIFWEYIVHDNGSSTTNQVVPPSIFEDCCLTIEESFDSVYRQARKDGSICPLEIKIVETGAFSKLMDEAISVGASISQYKTPRSLKLASFVDLLNSKVVSNNFSPKCPT